jgi:cold shock CspA family protein
MKIPVQIAFRGIPESDAVQAAIWKHAAELEHFYNRITSCRVVIDSPHRHQHKGTLYSVRIDLTVPGAEIVVNREHHLDHAHEDVFVAIRDAFDAARRRLEDHVRVMRGQTKAHAGPAIGHVARLFPNEDAGFLVADDGHEVYFHRHAIVSGDFDKLHAGDEVRFVEEVGEKGPQATTIEISHPHRLARQRSES